MKSSVVIGIGNPVISDDAVGIQVARRLGRALRGHRDIAVREIYNGGFELMEAMTGFDQAILVDAIVTGDIPGTIRRLALEDIAACRNTSTTHNGSLAVALEFGRLSGVKLPETVEVWAVEAGDVATFRESLSSEVQEAVPVVAAGILHRLLATPHRSGRLA